jgi:Cu/Ag efflux protein CusF
MNVPNKMIRLTQTTLTFACITFAALTSNTSAQTNANAGNARVVFSETNHLKATVENIDYDKRRLTLKGPRGNSVTFTVSDAVKNFPQIKKGDDVNIGYYESVALAVGKPGEMLTPTSRSEALVTSPAGQKPGAAAVAVSDITATVEDIDRENREVTLKGPEGNVVKVKVDPSVGNLERIKKGDQITASRTEALAISVEEPEASGTNQKNAEPK